MWWGWWCSGGIGIGGDVDGVGNVVTVVVGVDGGVGDNVATTVVLALMLWSLLPLLLLL